MNRISQIVCLLWVLITILLCLPVSAHQLAIGHDDVYIAVMGLTGSGKSSFIRDATGQDVRVCDDFDACTNSTQAYSFDHNGLKYHLIDTPGYDDSSRTDLQVLQGASDFFNSMYAFGLKLSGLLYFHRISDPKFQRAANLSLTTFKAMTGERNFPVVVVTTTMWDVIDENQALDRVRRMKSNPKYWGDMVQRGARVMKHTRTQKSALKILDKITPETMVMKIQEEMVDEKKSLAQTDAGKVLRADFQREIDELSSDAANNQRKIDKLREQIDKLEKERRDQDQAYEKILEELAKDKTWSARLKKVANYATAVHAAYTLARAFLPAAAPVDVPAIEIFLVNLVPAPGLFQQVADFARDLPVEYAPYAGRLVQAGVEMAFGQVFGG